MNGRIKRKTHKLRKGLKPILLVVCLTLLVSFQAQTQSREYQIKAEFLERFTRFIEWPAESPVSNPAQPFSICVIGKNPYGNYLKELATAVKIQKKPIVLTDISSIKQIESCNLLFIGDSQQAVLSAILEYTGEKPILTVSDTPGFAQQGVLINFYESDGFVRFEINPVAAKKSGLKFGSRLLKLGRLINPENNKEGNTDALP